MIDYRVGNELEQIRKLLQRLVELLEKFTQTH